MKTSENNTNQKQPPFLSSVGIIHLEQDGSFTEDDAKLNKKLVSQEAYPWLYDLDNNPESCLYLKKGYDLVNGWRFKRKDGWFRKLGSRFFNFVVRRYTGLSLRDENCGFKAYRRQVVENLFVYGQFHRLIPLQIYLRGFKICEIKIKNNARKHGVSKYKAF